MSPFTTKSPLFPRMITRHLVQVLTWSPVVLLFGPRQCGKTTLCKTLQARELLGVEYEYFTLDDQNLCDFANEDPVGFVDQLPPYVILDEVQRAVDIYRPLKMKVDANRIPGRFLLTGSAQLSLMGGLADSLVGRMVMVPLYPLAQYEVQSDSSLTSSDDSHSSDSLLSSELSIPTFLPKILNGGFDTGLVSQPRLGRELARHIVEGGYPEPRSLTSSDRKEWHRNYIRTLAFRDINELTPVRRVDVIPKLCKVAAAYTSQLFNLSDLQSSLELSRNSVNDYVSILQNLLILQYVPAWSSNRLKRAVKKPKLHFVDTGLACGLLDLDEEALWKDRKRLGTMTETLVLQEITKQAGCLEKSVSISHYRDRDRDEVDIVIEINGEGIIAIEVTISATVRDSHFRSIRKLQQQSDSFLAGIVLYDGEWTRKFGDKLFAIPISSLWHD